MKNNNQDTLYVNKIYFSIKNKEVVFGLNKRAMKCNGLLYIKVFFLPFGTIVHIRLISTIITSQQIGLNHRI